MGEWMGEFKDRVRQTAECFGWLMAGAVLGTGLALWKAPGSDTAMLAGAVLFPATIVLGWLLAFPLALLTLPFAIPRFLRWLREPLPTPPQAVPTARASRAGWVFVAAAIPTSLAAGSFAGAPFTFLLAGLLYGYGLRHSAALQDTFFDLS